MGQTPDLGILQVQAAYTHGLATPTSLLEQLHPLLSATSATFIKLFPLPDILQRCRHVHSQFACQSTAPCHLLIAQPEAGTPPATISAAPKRPRGLCQQPQCCSTNHAWLTVQRSGGSSSEQPLAPAWGALCGQGQHRHAAGPHHSRLPGIRIHSAANRPCCPGPARCRYARLC